MSRPTRTFIAIPISKERAEKLSRLQTLIAPSLQNARWVEPHRFHLTLAFLGDVPDTDLSSVCRAVTAAVARVSPFGLSIFGLGMFPNAERPRVVWAGFKAEQVEPLLDLQRKVASAVAEIGYAPEDARFSPHITLGHLKVGRGDRADHAPLLRHYERWAGGMLAVDEVVTYASQLAPEGPTYVALGRAPLKRK